MKAKFIEVTNGPRHNWGKMMLCRFEQHEWDYKSVIDSSPLIWSRGWDKHHILVVDLQTGEGALFRPGGVPSYDLSKQHAVWVCPMFEPFLAWLYKQDTSDLSKLPAHVDLPDAQFEMQGYRRPGPLDVKCDNCSGLGVVIVKAHPECVPWNASECKEDCAPCRGSGFIPRRDILPEELAEMFHGTYETLAGTTGQEQAATGKAWADLPEANRNLMIATASAILEALKAKSAKGTEGGQL